MRDLIPKSIDRRRNIGKVHFEGGVLDVESAVDGPGGDAFPSLPYL